MSALTFTLKKNPPFKVDCSPLTPNKLKNLTLKQISEIKLNHSIRLLELFEISGEDAGHIIFKNTSTQLDDIGHNMTEGTMIVEGDCGDFLGANLQNGTIICQGNAGERVGDKMRRGLILIDGNVGDYCASRMIAGTIGVYGKVGQYIGFGMKRGTILLKNKVDFHVTIQDCGLHTLPFLALLYQSFAKLPTKFHAIKNQRVQRFAGDLAGNGRGEVLIISQ